jgi:peptide/nickel transport system permease protein
VLLAVLGTIALLAPLLATDLPWIARDAGGLSFPAFGSLFGATPTPSDRGERPILSAPIAHGPNRIHLDATLLPPEPGHWLGTDDLGRDTAARVVHGARVSLGVGTLSAAFALLVGVPLGAWAGYRRGWVDFLVSRAVETVLSFPTLLLVLAILAVASGWLSRLSDVTRIALVLGLTGWMPIARYLRAEFLKLRESDMVSAARAVGGSDLRIAWRHILPSAMAPVLVTAAFAVGAAIGMEAALSFLGLGVRPPHATWGVLLADSREQIDRAWWLALFPGLALFGAVLACNLVGEGLRDLLDPRSSRR